MNSWQGSLRAFSHPRVVTMLFFGFSAGIPLLLIFSSLGLWLREAGVDRSTTTLFSWAALGYSFKFLWAPLSDCSPIPYLTRLLGRRRAWILSSQLVIMCSIILMSLTDPSAGTEQLKFMALSAVLLGFSSATQDIVIDAYRIESASSELQALMASSYVAGYRLGMITAGAGSLFIAGYFGSEMGSYSYSAWQNTYIIMSLTMLVGVITTFVVSEPDHYLVKENKYPNKTYIRLLVVFILSVTSFILLFHLSSDVTTNYKNYLSDLFKNQILGGFIVETIRLALGILMGLTVSLFCIKSGIIEKNAVFESYAAPVMDFFKRYGYKLALILLVLIGSYRTSDIVLGVIANIFYQDLGYSKNEIASIVKTFGLIMTIIGGFTGGIFAMHFSVMKVLFIGALLTVLTNLLFMLLAINGYNIPLLYFVISADNLSAGIASAAFIAFLSQLTNISFTATQYALFSSLMTLIPKVLGGYSGSIVDSIGYTQFFFVASMLGLPVLGVIWLADKHLEFE